MMRILSLGAGVQSSTIAFMAEFGEIEPIDCAIFADTGSEPVAVYNWLNHLRQSISFPIHIVRRGSLADDAVIVRKSKKSGNLYMKGLVPAFVLKDNGKTGLLSRLCTANYKIFPIQRKVRELLGIKRASKNCPCADMLIGISTDEAHRMKPSRVAFVKNEYPLIDNKMSRNDCLKWMERHGLPRPPRSACVFCPFRSDESWVELSKNDFNNAVMFERNLQGAARNQNALTGVPYLHRSCKPLDKIVFDKQSGYYQLELFGNECEGLCGV